MIATIYDLGSVHYPWRWALRCDYNAELVAALKEHIHYFQRKWMPEELRWWFHAGVIEDVVLLAERYCGRVHHGESSRAEGSTQGVPADVAAAYRMLYVTPDTPEEVIKAAYRALSQQYHPDAGGTTSEMQKLNAAFDRLKAK